MSLSEIIQSLPGKGSGLVELGKIKIGGKAKQVRTTAGGSNWRAPEKYDHFSITTMQRDGIGDLVVDKPLMDQLTAKFGDADGKLRSIPIRLLSDDIDDVIQSAFVWYGGKVVGARSDGKTVTWFYDPNSNPYQRYPEPVEEPWTPEHLTWKTGKGVPMFKVHSNFNCVIAANEAKWGGVYKFRTTSVISLRQIHASLLHLLQLTGGILVGMPLMLVVRPMQVAPDGKATTVHVVHVELRGGDMQQLQESALGMARFRLAFKGQIEETKRQYRQLLLPPGQETAEDAEEIGDEFSPDETIPPIDVVPAAQGYSLLDDAGAGDEAAAQPTAKAESELEQPITDQPAELPSPNEAIEDGEEDAEAARIRMKEAVGDVDDAKRNLRDFAKSSKGMGRAEYEKTLFWWLRQHGLGDILKTTFEQRVELWREIESGTFQVK